MLVVPVVVGAVIAGATWRHALLLITWLVAYLAFHTTGLWLKASRRPRYLPPVRAYGVSVVVLGTALVASDPALLRWAPVYLGLLAVSWWCSARRADRSWLNDAVTVVAASLMTVVSAGLGIPTTPAGAWPAAAVLGAYFLGTVPYVKTLIRERGRRSVLIVSVGYHSALLAAAVAIALLGGPLSLVVLAAGLLARAVLVPRRRPWPSAKAIGLGEIAATAAVTVVVLTLV
ncbi:hypothetical protein CCO02nite_14110 [Cellulomonas composti]|uniref:YwiC-like protein n=2 Tax=Cellulomonas composti TaxID=266130 RepID=A0A511JAL8_9CELL|nr:hypothetical protein CCO02nite_14110 [Cellulomonas composti]